MATDAQSATEYAHIVRTPGMMGGEPRVDGHRIRVRDVAAARDTGGATPEEIAATVYPSLTLAEVYAALAFFEDHRSEIESDIAAEKLAIEQFQQTQQSLLGQAPSNHSN